MGELKDRLNNFSENRYTRHDYFSIQSEFEKGLENEAFLAELEEQWDEIENDKVSDFELKKIWNNIINHVGLNPETIQKSVFPWAIMQKAAAILFLPLLIASFFYYSSTRNSGADAWAEITCPAGARTEFKLPDGSTGFLNSKSTLKYPINFKENRDVRLVGEAFFDVVKSRHKFTVTTSRLKIEVLGTCFNVLAYNDLSSEEITLKRGSVRVLDKKNNQLADLAPNQQVVLDKQHNWFTKKEVNASNYISWISGKLIMQNERFEDVAKKLSRWYDVEIEVESQELKDFQYYATFEDEPLEQVLKLISITAPIQYEEKARIKHNDGSFTKRKIKFKLNEDRLKDFN
ncbi:FecR family protein [Sunxiuqinia sp. A32]|uniref:FecR family protein n=1 Tax=Sunxiuqinia sp. A32 TaxID=3461496 RepID=UPI0040457C40